MKVLYIGYYKENSDWGELTRNNILALDSAGVDVACRGVEMGASIQPEGRILELEKKDIEDCDVCIQHVFPDAVVGSTKFKKNIAILSNTFVSLRHSLAIDYLKQVDEVWLPNTSYEQNLKDLLNTKVIPTPCDTEKFKRRYQDVNIPQVAGKFIFYAFINSADANSIDSIFSSFHSEFDYCDNVCLVVVVTDPTEEAKNKVNQSAQVIKEQLNLNKNTSEFHREVIITDPQLDTGHLLAMHQSGHCFIGLTNNPSGNHGFDAIGLGSRAILLDIGGNQNVLNAIDDEYVYPVSYILKSKKGASATLEMNCGKDFSCVSSDQDLKKGMRQFYEEWLKNPVSFENSTKSAGFSACEAFSMQKAGEKMKEIIND